MAVEITGSVGSGGQNDPFDTWTIQSMLNATPPELGGADPLLETDDLVGPLTIGAIRHFQQVQQLAVVDGRVDPGQASIARLNEVMVPQSVDVQTQLDTYVNEFGIGSGMNPPATSQGNRITPLIDGRRYFREIRDTLNSLGSGGVAGQHFFYLTGWTHHLIIGSGANITTAPLVRPVAGGAAVPVLPNTGVEDARPAITLAPDDGGSAPVLADLLASKAAAGVDVRVAGWINPLLMTSGIAAQAGSLWGINVSTLRSLIALRDALPGSGKPLSGRVMALTIGHLVGAMHLKMAVASNGVRHVAYVGGIDFDPSRIADEMHATENWHDLAMKIEGPAVQDLVNHFRNLWNEQFSRNAVEIQVTAAGGSPVNHRDVPLGAQLVPARTLTVSPVGRHRVQVARTLPQFKFGGTPSAAIRAFNLGALIPSALTFEPNGVFEVASVLLRAIAGAQRYIYIEDQAFWSQDVMDAINARVKADPNVKVVLVTGDRDPADAPNDGIQVQAVNVHLLAGLNAQQLGRVRFFTRRGVIVHSKVTLIDDHWILAGSANCTRRSLFTDGEACVAVIDETDLLTRQLRIDLWGGHFGLAKGTGRIVLKDLNGALGVWEPAWGTAVVARPSNLQQIPLPMGTPAVPFDQSRYDNFDDPDSRTNL